MNHTCTNELVRHAVDAWGYLVERNSRKTFIEFADMIRSHSSHKRGKILANTLESISGVITHDWRGFRATWQSCCL